MTTGLLGTMKYLGPYAGAVLVSYVYSPGEYMVKIDDEIEVAEELVARCTTINPEMWDDTTV